MSDLTTLLSRATNLVWYADGPDDWHTAGWTHELHCTWRESPQEKWQTWTLTEPFANRAANLGRQTHATLPDVVAHQLESWGSERRAKVEADSSLALPGVR